MLNQFLIQCKIKGRVILAHKINWYNALSYINQYNFLNKVLRRLKISQEIIISNDFMMDMYPVTRTIGNKDNSWFHQSSSLYGDTNEIYDQIEYLRDIFNYKSLRIVSKCQTIHISQLMKNWDKLDTNIIARELVVWYDKVDGDKWKLNIYVPESAKPHITSIFVQIQDSVMTLLYFQLLDWISWFPKMKHVNIISDIFSWDNFTEVIDWEFDVLLSYFNPKPKDMQNMKIIQLKTSK